MTAPIRTWLRRLAVCGPLLLPAISVAQSMDPEPAESAEFAVAAAPILDTDLSACVDALDGVIGVAALHLESGRALELRGDQRFPMASTYKLAIAVELLRRVDAEQCSLDEELAIRPGDLHPGSGTLESTYRGPGTCLPVRALLERMLVVSDNSATDLLLRRVEGPAAVHQMLLGAGLGDMRIDRSTLRMICDWAGLESVPEDEQLEPSDFLELYSQIPNVVREQAEQRFETDDRDTCTPNAMLGLLRAILTDDALLAPSSRSLLLSTMAGCETGDARIRGRLPKSTPVAHKTGTIGGTTNDVGIITLPDERGHLALAIFVKDSRRSLQERERVIAAIARTLYDACLLPTPSEHDPR